MKDKINVVQGLRGLAILLIVLWHLNDIFPGNLPKTGDRGVEIFLLISGFLIGIKYINSNKMNTLRDTFLYSVNKIKKMYPLYILSGLLMLTIEMIKIHSFSEFIELSKKTVSYFFVIQSWIPNEDFYWCLNGVAWFIPVIMFCYFMTAPILALIRTVDGRILIGIFLVLKGIIEIVCFFYLDTEMATYITYICPAYRVLDYSIGIFIASVYMKNNQESQKKGRSVMTAAVVCIYLFAVLFLYHYLSYTVYHFFETFIVLLIVNKENVLLNKVLENKIFVGLGNISMEIFLTHLPVITYASFVWEKIAGEKFVVIEWGILLTLIIVIGFLIKNNVPGRVLSMTSHK